MGTSWPCLPRLERTLSVILALELAPEPAAVVNARHAATQALDAHGCRSVRAGAELVISELVANALEHSGTRVAVRLLRAERRVRVEVDDDGQGWPVLRHPEPHDQRGRGLQIVDQVASRWGVQREAGNGKTLWAELAC